MDFDNLLPPLGSIGVNFRRTRQAVFSETSGSSIRYRPQWGDSAARSDVRLVPRSLMPDKPISTGETIAVYPDVAERGTNITFPLKANLVMHFGPPAYWLDWVVVALAQIAFVLGACQRSRAPRLWSFAAIFMGCAFTLIARGGIINARLLDQILLFVLAYLLYRSVQGLSEARKQQQGTCP